MIVVSGALCLVALVLLVVGLVLSSGLTLIYASIAVSLVSFVFLFLGVRQRRPVVAGGAVTPTPGPISPGPVPVSSVPTAATEAEVTRVVPAAEVQRAPAAAPVASEPVGDDRGDAAVFVVPGRPRYHAEGCRFLADREVEQMSRDEARAAGYKACAVCRVDSAVAEAPPTAPVPAEEAPAPPGRPAAAAARRRSAAEPVGPDAEAARGREQQMVYVIPDRGRYHRAECRYVRGVSEAVEIAKTAARRQGYQPCGVCRP